MPDHTDTAENDGDKPRADAESDAEEPRDAAALETLSAALRRGAQSWRPCLLDRSKARQAARKHPQSLQAGPQCPARLRARDTTASGACRSAGAAGMPSSTSQATASKPAVPTRVNLTLATQPGPETSVVVTTRGRGWDEAKRPTGPRAAPHSRDLLAQSAPELRVITQLMSSPPTRDTQQPHALAFPRH